MAANLRDPRFDVSKAASLCRISTRYLHSLMRRQDTTLTRELLQARLLRAFDVINSPAGRTLQIGEIAYDCGFANQGHFATRSAAVR